MYTSRKGYVLRVNGSVAEFATYERAKALCEPGFEVVRNRHGWAFVIKEKVMTEQQPWEESITISKHEDGVTLEFCGVSQYVPRRDIPSLLGQYSSPVMEIVPRMGKLYTLLIRVKLDDRWEGLEFPRNWLESKLCEIRKGIYQLKLQGLNVWVASCDSDKIVETINPENSMQFMLLCSAEAALKKIRILERSHSRKFEMNGMPVTGLALPMHYEIEKLEWRITQ